MAEPVTADAETLRVGMLMESAQIHQQLAEAHLEQLRTHTHALDQIVREEIRRALIEELRWLAEETERTTRALAAMRRAARIQGLGMGVGMVVLGLLIPAIVAHWLLPSESSIASLRLQRDTLARSVEDLERQGGKVEWNRCGDAKRLCVRVDRAAPNYGPTADYYIVKEH